MHVPRLTERSAVDLLQDIWDAVVGIGTMASFITTMFVSPPFPNMCPKSLPIVSSPIQIVPLRTSLAMNATIYAEATKEPRQGYQDEDKGLSCDINRNARTRGQFKPKHANKGTSSYQLRQFAEATLGSGSLKKAVKLPEGEDLSEWLAVNGNKNRAFVSRSGWHSIVVDFYNQINLLYGSITEFCSPQSCPEMKATDE